jgi:hypothetical protein
MAGSAQASWQTADSAMPLLARLLLPSLAPTAAVSCCSSTPAAPDKKSKRSSLQAIREGAVVRTYVQQERSLINQPARFRAQHRVCEQGGWYVDVEDLVHAFITDGTLRSGCAAGLVKAVATL